MFEKFLGKSRVTVFKYMFFYFKFILSMLFVFWIFCGFKNNVEIEVVLTITIWLLILWSSSIFNLIKVILRKNKRNN